MFTSVNTIKLQSKVHKRRNRKGTTRASNIREDAEAVDSKEESLQHRLEIKNSNRDKSVEE